MFQLANFHRAGRLSSLFRSSARCSLVLIWALGAIPPANSQRIGPGTETIHAPFWRIGGGFSTTIAVNNTQPRPIEVQPVIVDHTGKELRSRSFSLQALESRDIPLEALIEAKHSYGQIALRFAGQPLDLAAQVVIRHENARTTFNGGFMHRTAFKDTTFVGVSPIGGASQHSLLALANVSDRPRKVRLQFSGRRERVTIEIGARETRLAPLQAVADGKGSDGKGSDSRNDRPQPVGLTVEHDGAPGEVLMHGMLREHGGEATNLHIVERHKLQSNRLLSPGLRVIASQSPLLALNNLSEVPLAVVATAHFRRGDDPQTAVLRSIPVGARETVALDLSRDLRDLPRDATEMGLSLSYEGGGGRLAAELLLLDGRTRSAVQSTPKDAGADGAIGLSFPFRLDRGGNTIVTLANPSETEEVMYCVFLLYNGKTYTWIEDKTLTPGEVRHIDIRRLRDERIPGELKEMLPRDLVSGQVSTVVHNELSTYHRMIGQSVQVHPGGESSAFLSCPMCPPSPSHVTLSPLSFTGNVGTNQQIWPYIHWSNGTYKVNNNPFAINWSPGNSSIATVSEAWNNFRVQFGPQFGLTTIGAEMPNECVYQYDYFLGQCQCQYTLPVYSVAAAQVTARKEWVITTRAFIIPNNVGPDPLTCTTSGGVYFKGDNRSFSSSSTQYRTQQKVTYRSNPSGTILSHSRNVGQSRTYASNALANGSIGPEDEDGVGGDCSKWHAAATASNGGMFASLSGNNGVKIYGGAGNPLSTSPDIDWDYTINFSSATQYSLTVTHDCYPAHEAYIGSHTAYTFTPSSNSMANIGSCLLGAFSVTAIRTGTVL